MSEELRPCPKCKGEIILYSRVNADINYNCLARCQKCKLEYPMPEAKMKARGTRWQPQSIAARILKISNGNIGDCLHKKINSAGGFLWEYAQ